MTTHSKGKPKPTIFSTEGMPRCPDCKMLCADTEALKIHLMGGCGRLRRAGNRNF